MAPRSLGTLASVLIASMLSTGCAPRISPIQPTTIDLSTMPLVPVETVTTATMRIAFADHEYSAFFGTYVGMPEESMRRPPPGFPPPSGAFTAFLIGDTSNGQSYLGAGFSYFWGRRPYGTTTRGSGTSDGSIMLIQNDATRMVAGVKTFVDRFFFLEGTSMTVKNAGETQSVTVTVINRYVDVDDAGMVYAEAVIPTSGPIFDFVNDVITQVGDNGDPTPSSWPP